MSFASFGTGGASVDYITREKAAEQISFVNLPELQAETKSEQRANAIAYAELRIGIEKSKRKNARTNYKLLLSWGRKEAAEVADKMATDFLEKNFPTARAIIAVHQDTDNTHAHIWIDARGSDEKKLRFKKNEYQTIDERWHQAFDREYGTNYFAELKAKKIETAAFKRARAQGITAVKPIRAGDKFSNEYWRNKEIENLTGERIEVVTITELKRSQSLVQSTVEETIKNEQVGLGINQQSVTAKNGEAGRSERRIEAAKREVAGTEPTLEAIIEQCEREQHFAQRIVESYERELPINFQSSEGINFADGTNKIPNQLGQRGDGGIQVGAEQVGKTEKRIGTATDEFVSSGNQENIGSDIFSVSGADQGQGEDQNDQRKLGFDIEKTEDGDDGIKRNEKADAQIQLQLNGLSSPVKFDPSNAVNAASEFETKEISDNGFYQNKLGRNSESGKTDNANEEEIFGRDKQFELIEQPLPELFKTNQFREESKGVKITSFYDHKSDKFITETVSANGMWVTNNDFYMNQLDIFKSFDASNLYVNPFVNPPETANLFSQTVKSQTGEPDRLSISSPEITKTAQEALENLSINKNQIDHNVTEATQLLTETGNTLKQISTAIDEDRKMPQLLDEEKVNFQISDEIKLNPPVVKEVIEDNRQIEQMELRQGFGGMKM